MLGRGGEGEGAKIEDFLKHKNKRSKFVKKKNKTERRMKSWPGGGKKIVDMSQNFVLI